MNPQSDFAWFTSVEGTALNDYQKGRIKSDLQMAENRKPAVEAVPAQIGDYRKSVHTVTELRGFLIDLANRFLEQGIHSLPLYPALNQYAFRWEKLTVSDLRCDLYVICQNSRYLGYEDKRLIVEECMPFLNKAEAVEQSYEAFFPSRSLLYTVLKRKIDDFPKEKARKLEYKGGIHRSPTDLKWYGDESEDSDTQNISNNEIQGKDPGKGIKEAILGLNSIEAYVFFKLVTSKKTQRGIAKIASQNTPNKFDAIKKAAQTSQYTGEITNVESVIKRRIECGALPNIWPMVSE